MKKKAFSLVELSIVILIIGILIAGVTQSSRLVEQFKLSAARSKTKSSPVNSIKGLSMWLEAVSIESFLESETEDQATVSIWNDIGLQGYKTNATQNSTTNRPAYTTKCINGLPCLRFNGSSSFLNYDAAFLVNSNFSIFIVEQRRNDTGNSPNYFIGGANEVDNGLLHLGYKTNIKLTFSQYNNNFSANTTGYSNPVPKIHSYVLNQGVGRNYFIDGVSFISETNSTPLSSYDSAQIGAYGNSSASYFDGDIAEIIMFNRALNSEERKSVESYLSEKWNIKI